MQVLFDKIERAAKMHESSKLLRLQISVEDCGMEEVKIYHFCVISYGFHSYFDG